MKNFRARNWLRINDLYAFLAKARLTQICGLLGQAPR